jgi:prepilin-type N-terminal cleavage/methylation domain-containing protein
MKKTNSSLVHSGFTLIELLVVVAIIALLAATILTSLASARSKAKDAKITSELSSVRAQMELYYNSNSFSYGTASDCASGAFATGTDNASNLIMGIDKDTGDTGTFSSTNIVCGSDGASWAVMAKLSTGDNWCVDSNGDSKKATSIGTGPYVCTP